MKIARTFCAGVAAAALLAACFGKARAQNAGAMPIHPDPSALLDEFNWLNDGDVSASARNELNERLKQQQVEIEQLRAQIANERSAAPANNVPLIAANNPYLLAPAGATPTPASSVGKADGSRTDSLPAPSAGGATATSTTSSASDASDSQTKMDDGYEVGTDKSLITSWNNGFEAKSKHGDFRFRLGGLLQFDTSWLDTDPALLAPPAVGGIGSNPDSMQIRRARITFDGTYYEVIDFRFEYDFANFISPASPSAGQPVVDTPGLTELWAQWTQIPVVGTIRVGNQKEPLGLEHVEPIKYLSFIEPSYLFDMVFGPFNLGFSPGVQVLNCTQDQNWAWQYGVFGNNTDGFGYSIHDDWAATARATHLLWYDEPSQGRYMWDVGVSGSVRTPDEDLVRLRTRGNIRSGPPGVLNPIYADTGSLGSDEQDILAFETFAQYGRWSLQAEYAGTWIQDAVQGGVDRGTPFFHGGYVELLYFLTGDCRTYNKQIAAPDRIVPLENAYIVQSANGCCTGSGAWQVGVRYSAIDLNDNDINGGILNSMTVGLNWFLNPNTIVQFNYDLTHRSEVGATPAGFINGFGARLAFNF